MKKTLGSLLLSGCITIGVSFSMASTDLLETLCNVSALAETDIDIRKSKGRDYLVASIEILKNIKEFEKAGGDYEQRAILKMQECINYSGFLGNKYAQKINAVNYAKSPKAQIAHSHFWRESAEFHDDPEINAEINEAFAELDELIETYTLIKFEEAGDSEKAQQIKQLYSVAKEGDDGAQLELGLSLVDFSITEAFKWINRAAKNGNISAKGYAALFYAVGELVVQDKAYAYQLLREVEARGSDEDKRRLVLFQKQIDAAERFNYENYLR